MRIANAGCVTAALSRPPHFGRHGAQNGVDVAAGLETEGGTTVVEEVELDVAAAADELVVAIGLGPWGRVVAVDELGVNLEEGAADILGEGEVVVPVAARELIVEDAADAARLV